MKSSHVEPRDLMCVAEMGEQRPGRKGLAVVRHNGCGEERRRQQRLIEAVLVSIWVRAGAWYQHATQGALGSISTQCSAQPVHLAQSVPVDLHMGLPFQAAPVEAGTGGRLQAVGQVGYWSIGLPQGVPAPAQM